MPRWRLSLAVFAAAVLLTAACGGSGGDDDPPATAPDGSTAGAGTTNDPAPEPHLDGPASRYSLLNPEDFGSGFITDIGRTFELTAENYTANNGAWSDPAKGKAQLEGWGYESGYQTAVVPENRDNALLQGGVGVILEVHLFDDEAGAKQAYEFFKTYVGGSGVSPVGTNPVGNESIGWKYISGTILQSNVEHAYYIVMFRRGNLVATVVAHGADTLMKSDEAVSRALLIDAKALGTRAATQPTPTGNSGATAYPSTTPSPSATP